MKLLAFSDIHGNHAVYKRIPELVRKRRAECIVLAGDLLGLPDDFASIEEAQRSDAAKIVRLLESLDVPLFYIMGNDDWVDLQPSEGRFQALHGRRVDLGQTNFVGYQYTLPFMGGINERTEEVMAKDLERLEPLLDRGTVLVTHGPAYGTLDYGILDRHIGSTSLRDVIARTQVRLHIHGHTHSLFGRAGRHFNVAAARKMRGMAIDTNSLEHEVIDETVP